MKLIYYQTTKNFGDQLNPLIFHYFLPGFFDNKEDCIFLGIGTILGLEKGNRHTGKIIVFSSGYGFGDTFTYGEPPTINNMYDIICVRGPLTAQKLGLDKDLGISDGALLLNNMKFPDHEKIYKYAYMPHHVSEGMYEYWKDLSEKAGIHYISPQQDASRVLEEIRKTEILLTEAMHGAIVADVFRVPWVPVKSYQHINAFKWKDWALTLDLNFEHHVIKSLFNDKKSREIIEGRFYSKWKRPLKNLAHQSYKILQKTIREKEVINEFKKLKDVKPFLSNQNILTKRANQLEDKIQSLKMKYPR
jgi:succinoglycan biosynthesis protein ExoV